MKTIHLPTYSEILSFTASAALIALTAVATNSTAQAATFTWDGGGGDANWSTGTNWDGDVAPTYNTTTYETLNFAGTTNLTANNNYGDGNNTDSILFDASAGAFTLTGGSIDMLGRADLYSAAGVAYVTNNSTNTQTINNNLINRADFNTSLVFQNTDGGSIVVNGSVTEAGGSATLSKISGGSLELTGTGNTATNMNAAGGNTILSGTSTTTVSNTLYVANSGISGGGVGTLTVQDSATLTSTKLLVGNNYNRNGTVNQTGGTVNLTGSGTIDIRLGHWGNLTGTYNLTGGTLNTLNTNFILGWDGQGILNVDGGTANLKGIHYGASTSVGTLNLDGGTLKLGSGGMTDIDRNGQSGNSTINLESGTLGALASWSTGLDMNMGGTVDIDTTGGNITLNGDLSGGGGFTKTGSGTLTLSGANTYSGGTTIDGGTLAIAGGTISESSAIVINDTATLRFDRNDTWGQAVTDTSSSITINAGGTMESGGFFTTIRDLNLNGGTVALTGGTNATYPALALKGTVTVGGSQASQINYVSGYDNNMINIGDDNLGATEFDVADVTNDASADLTVNAVLQNNSLVGGNSLTKTGAGTMELTATNTYTGSTTVSAGTLSLASSYTHSGSGAYIVNGGTLKIADGVNLGSHAMTISLGGVISPGNSPGTAIVGTQNWGDGGSYLWEINNSGGLKGDDPGWDWLSITGDLNLGTLGASQFTIDITSLDLSNNSGLATGFDYSGLTYGDLFDTFIIATTSGDINDFNSNLFSLNDSAFVNSKWDWQIRQNGKDLVLDAIFVPEPSSTALLGIGGLALLLRRKRS